MTISFVPRTYVTGDRWSVSTANTLETRIDASFASAETDVTTLDSRIDATEARLDAVEVAAVNTRTANYTLVLSDAGKAVEMNLATATTLTVPPSTSVAFLVGTIIEITRLGAGSVNIAPGAGVTIRSADNLLSLRVQYSSASLRKRATNEWVLVGDLA